MSEFLSFAWELLSKVVYNIVAVFAALLNLLVFGWVDYFNIFLSYFNAFHPVGKIGAVILFALLDFKQTGTQYLHRFVSVFELASLILTLDNHAGRQMRDANG